MPKGKYIKTIEHRRNISKNHADVKGENNPNWKGGKIKIICQYCGKPSEVKSYRIRKGEGKYCNRKCVGLSQRGKEESKETRRKKSKAKKGKNNFMYNKKHSKEVRQKMRVKRINFLSSDKMPRKKTSIEIAIEGELKQFGLNYQSNVPLCNIGVVDFLLPDYDIVIECDGNYWHNPKYFPKATQRDANQNLVYSFNGYKVFRFWEDEIKKSSKRCINKVLKSINRTTKAR